MREYDSELRDYGLLCRCYVAKTAYAISYTQPQAVLHGYLSIELEYVMLNLMILPALMLILFLLCCCLFFTAHFYDGKDARKVRNIASSLKPATDRLLASNARRV